MRKWMNHESPWGVEYADYFVTICCRPRGLNQLCWHEKIPFMMESLENYHGKRRWFCSIALWMPDHIHMIVQIGHRERFSALVGDFKRYLSRNIGVKWHRGFFDHRIRRHETLEEKWRYIQNNPARAGLARSHEEWPFRWEPESLSATRNRWSGEGKGSECGYGRLSQPS